LHCAGQDAVNTAKFLNMVELLMVILTKLDGDTAVERHQKRLKTKPTCFVTGENDN
jgi:signal recognition particle GTPase